MRTVVFITVNYNNSVATLQWLDSIDRLDDTKLKQGVLIVDNASKDKELELLQREVGSRERVTILHNSSNVGYFRALNVALRTIHKSQEGLFVVAGNNDIKFRSDFLVNLAQVECSSTAFVLAPDLVSNGDLHQNPHHIRPMSRWRKAELRLYFSSFCFREILRWINRRVAKKSSRRQKSNVHVGKQPIHMCIGACFVLTENFFLHCQELDDRVFLYGEEALLAHQVHSAGGHIIYEPDLVAYHKHSSSIGKLPERESYRIARESYRIYRPYL